MAIRNIHLDKARRTHGSHSRGYATEWGLKYRDTDFYTGDFCKDFKCSVEELARIFEFEDRCPICGDTYASMTEGKTGLAANPLNPFVRLTESPTKAVLRV